ncbi:MAG: hypothetical protein ACKOA8_14625, partial [Deltaproteobacteria bacterium]
MQKRYLTVFLLLLLSLNTSYGEPSSLQRVSEFTISATQTQFNLSWKFIAPAGVTNLDFRIQRKRVQDLDWVALPPVSGTLQALTDSPADGASVDYYYRIRVTGKLNGEFIFSGWKWATPNANRFLPAPPLAITDLRAENVTSSQTELKWTSSTRSERIQIYRKEGTTAGQLVGEVNANSSNFVDRNVTP